MSTDALKQEAGEAAVEAVSSGMVVGLGTGSTAIWAVRAIGRKLRDGGLTDVVGIPTSSETDHKAMTLGIPLTTLEQHPVIDLTIDGADEIAPGLMLIKGGGGALLREKIVAQASKRLLIVADSSKQSPQLGTHWPLPVEVVAFGWATQRAYLESLGATVTLREANGQPYRTDHGNYILDCNFGRISDPIKLATLLKARTGIVEHGLFIDLAHAAIIATESGIERLIP